jgi:hypothetical protein
MEKIHKTTISRYLNFENVQIGGPNITIKIDEPKLGKRKYQRGHRIDGI